MKQTNEEITQMVMELQLEDNKSLAESRDNRVRCAEYLSEIIQNMLTQLNGNDNNMRYSAHTINVPLSLYLRNKKSYSDLRDSGLLVLHHPRLL